MKRVTGLGGVFFKCRDKDKLKSWYQTHLGIGSQPFGDVFTWREMGDSGETGYTVWGTFADDTKYFEPSQSAHMLNYRVADLVALIEVLKQEGVEVVGDIKQEENGKFAWLMDPEGNKIELWEPMPNKDDPYLPAPEEPPTDESASGS
jgi:predicted enzyme related to lactoylglutathione lyase